MWLRLRWILFRSRPVLGLVGGLRGHLRVISCCEDRGRDKGADLRDAHGGLQCLLERVAL